MNKKQQGIDVISAKLIIDFLQNFQALVLFKQIKAQFVKELQNVGDMTIGKLEKQIVRFFNINKIIPKNLSEVSQSCCEEVIHKKIYVCYDCKSQIDSFMCESCFYDAGHHIYCRYSIKQIDSQNENSFKCSCGNYQKLKYRATCSKHHKILKMAKCSLQQQQKDIYAKELVNCMKFIIGFKHVSDRLHQTKEFSKQTGLFVINLSMLVSDNFSHASKFIQFINQLNTRTDQYIQITQKALLTRINMNQCFSNIKSQQQQQQYKQQGKQQNTVSLMYLFLKLMPNSRIFKDLITTLLRLQNLQFLKELFNNIFGTKCISSMYSTSFVISLKQKNVIKPRIFCQLIEQVTNQGAFNTESQLTSALQIYASVACPQQFLDPLTKQKCSLSSCWKSLQNKKFLTIQNMQKLQCKRSLKSIYFNFIYDREVFSNAIIQLIQFIHNKIQEKANAKDQTFKNKKISVSQMCNMLCNILLMFSKGNIRQAAAFLFQLSTTDKSKVINEEINISLCHIIYYFLSQCMDSLNNLSQQSLFCFGMYLHLIQNSELGLNKINASLWEDSFPSIQKSIDFIAKILNILIGQQMKWISRRSSYIQICSQERVELEKVQCQKFKQLLYMRKCYPVKQIQQLAKENILNFEKAPEILRKYTRLDAKNNCYIYNHEQAYFSYDGIINNIFALQNADNVCFTPEETDHAFSKEWRSQILQGIMYFVLDSPKQHIYEKKQINSNLCKCVTKNHQYTKQVCLIVIDKIVNGRFKSLRNYLMQKRNQLRQMPKLKTNDQMHVKLVQLFNVTYCQALTKQKVIFNEQISQINPQSYAIQNNHNDKQQTNAKDANNEHKQSNKLNQIVNCHQTTEVCKQNSQNTKLKSQSSKLMMLKQKLNSRRQAFLNALPQNVKTKQIDHHNICMICRQESQTNNTLFYLGVLKKQPPIKSMFNSSYSSEYNINVCMHMIHQKCFTNLCKNGNNNYPCPLCKLNANILFPVETLAMSECSRQFMQNRLNYIYVNVFNEYHPDKCFIFIVKNVINEIVFSTILSIILHSQEDRKVQVSKKVCYYMKLLEQWWDSFLPYQKQYYLHILKNSLKSSTQVGFKLNQQLKINNPKIVIDRILMCLVISKITKQRQVSQLQSLLSYLSSCISTIEFQYFIKYLNQLLSCHIKLSNMEQKQIQKLPFVQYYFTAPKNITTLHSQTKQCQTCMKQRKVNVDYYMNMCLICGKKFCNACGHDKVHGHEKAYIDGNVGQIWYFDKNMLGKSKKIYFNTYHQGWKTADYNWIDYFDFNINRRLLNQSIWEWLSSLRN